VKLGRCALLTIATSAAVVLAATAIPAQAKPVPASSTPPPVAPFINHAGKVARSPLSRLEPVVPYKDLAVTPLIICEYHSDYWCEGAHFGTPNLKRGPKSGAEVVIQGLDEISRATTLVMGIEWLATKFGWVAKVIDVLATPSDKVYAERIDRQVQGKCFGAWGRYADITYGNCKSRRGVYWHFQDMGTHDYRLWNNSEFELMTTGSSLDQNEDTWITSERNAQAKGYWRTWADYNQ
jgi:hypothetical protein